MPKTEFLSVAPAIASHVAEFIETNRDQLIKAAVPDPESQKQLLAISAAIRKMKLHDPSVVAAWGLGCGNKCASSPTDRVSAPQAIIT
jgi:hypothetical protein